MLAIFLNITLLLGSPSSANCMSCLPRDIKCDDVVSAQPVYSKSNRGEVRTITVAQTLRQIRARCRKGKLVDGKGKEIHFYKLNGCWGNPPDNYQEILDGQAKELEKLRQRYRVIALTCNPSGSEIS